MTAALAAAAPVLDGRWLVVQLPGPHAVLSWAIVIPPRAAASAPIAKP